MRERLLPVPPGRPEERLDDLRDRERLDLLDERTVITADAALSMPPRAPSSIARNIGPFSPPWECPMKYMRVASKRTGSPSAVHHVGRQAEFAHEPRLLHHVERALAVVVARRVGVRDVEEEDLGRVLGGVALAVVDLVDAHRGEARAREQLADVVADEGLVVAAGPVRVEHDRVALGRHRGAGTVIAKRASYSPCTVGAPSSITIAPPSPGSA